MKYLFTPLLILMCLGLLGQEKNQYARPDLPGELMVDIGFSQWSKTVSDLDQKVWPSKSFGIYYMKSKKLNEKFRFNYGIGITMDKIGFATNLDSIGGTSDYLPLIADTLGVAQFAPTVGITERISFERYSIKNTYLDIPIELRFHPNGSEVGEGFFFSVGGILGLRIKSKDKLVAKLNDEKIKVKNSGDVGFANVRYGAQARLGWRGIHIFYKQYFNREFRDKKSVKTFSDPDGQTFNPTLATFGINITGF